MNKTVGIIGLGLIGGSLAKALKLNTTNIVCGSDADEGVVSTALSENAIDERLVDLGRCDIILIALYPNDTVDFVKSNIDDIKRGAVIIDCAGVKSPICEELSELCNNDGKYFIGGHPMAGVEKSGYSNSFAHLFNGATMILCTDKFTNSVAIKAAELLFTNIGFKQVVTTTAAEHDRIIAYTSQLAHIVSSAFIKSETAKNQEGFSAGSYKDLTRVAFLNENMWSELFMLNRQNLSFEINKLIERLGEYAGALEEADMERLKKLLIDGKREKEAIG